MKITILILILSCALLEIHSSPIQIVQNDELVEEIKNKVATSVDDEGRQAAAPQPAVPGVDEDDDDDEDDDEGIEDALVDDDDDDDDDDDAAPTDDDDDDEEDDYLERIFDDILDDDDDDEDDDPSPAVVQSPVAAQPQPAISEPAVSSVVNEIDTAGAAGLNADYPNEADQQVFYDEENTPIDTKVDIQSLNSKPLDSVQTNVVQKVSSVQQQVTNAVSNVSDDDDDDDDDDDGIEGALDVDDDDDDDDDDDEFIGGGVIEAKRARSLEDENAIPEALTGRYNRFVDGIFNRINKILKTSYDPVRVRLVNAQQSKSKNSNGKRRKSPAKKNRRRSKDLNLNSDKIETKSNNMMESKIGQHGIPQKFITSSSQTPASATQQKIRGNKIANKKTSNKVKSTKLKSPQNNPNEKSRKAEGTLYGLSSLKRVGNVRVMPVGNNSTVKAKFTLGPLTLKVEKSFKRGTVRNIKSATARTNEMMGRINLRVLNGAATLVSIKVQQPKQVQVDSPDNHDRTREFVWKRTPHIAHLVSEKLRAAAESLLRPVGSEVVRQ